MNYLQSCLTDNTKQNIATSTLHSLFENIESFQLQSYAKKKAKWKKQARNLALDLFTEGNILKLQEFDEVLKNPEKSKFNKERYLSQLIQAKNDEQLDPDYPKLRSDLMVENTKVLDCAVTILEKSHPSKPMYRNIDSCGRAIHVRLNRMTGKGYSCSKADDTFDYDSTAVRKILTEVFVNQVRKDKKRNDLCDRDMVTRAKHVSEEVKRVIDRSLDSLMN